MAPNSSPELQRWVDSHLAVLYPAADWQPNLATGLSRLKEKQSVATLPIRRWTLAAALACLLAISFLALPSSQVLAHRCLECTVAVLQSLSPQTSVQADLKPENSRKLAPGFILKDSDANDVALASLKGKVVLVNFWATWCHGCQVEIPWFTEFHKKYQETGLVVVGVSMDDDGWKSVKPWLKEKQVNYPIVIGNEPLAGQYGLEGMPLTVLIDREGKIADVHAGLVDKHATERKIRVLLAEKPSRPSN